jgi:hypothetical protein
MEDRESERKLVLYIRKNGDCIRVGEVSSYSIDSFGEHISIGSEVAFNIPFKNYVLELRVEP